MILTVVAALVSAACGSDGNDVGASASPPDQTMGSTSGKGTGATALGTPVPDPIEGCVPRCNTPGIVAPGPVPEGLYETQWFFGGEMVVSLDEPWMIQEDSTGEFALSPRAFPSDSVLFWEDVYPVKNDRQVTGVPMTAQGLLKWMQNDPRLVVSDEHKGRIGDLPATVVDVSVAEGARNDDPGCPTPVCVLFLGFPQWDGSFGITDQQTPRLYLSNVTYGGEQHLSVAVIYADLAADTDVFRPRGEDLIATVQVPAGPA
jgi:hypothetical protein